MTSGRPSGRHYGDELVAPNEIADRLPDLEPGRGRIVDHVRGELVDR